MGFSQLSTLPRGMRSWDQRLSALPQALDKLRTKGFKKESDGLHLEVVLEAQGEAPEEYDLRVLVNVHL
jgi:hypothetical protein